MTTRQGNILTPSVPTLGDEPKGRGDQKTYKKYKKIIKPLNPKKTNKTNKITNYFKKDTQENVRKQKEEKEEHPEVKAGPHDLGRVKSGTSGATTQQKGINQIKN